MTDRVLVERRLRAMGCDVHLVVAPAAPVPGAPEVGSGTVDAEGVLDAAVARIDELEQRWSRFRPDSELSRLNAGAGSSQEVSADTAAVLALALEGWERTAGRFDPTVLDALVAAGYDRTFTELAPPSGGGTAADADTVVVPGADRIVLDEATRRVSLPAGVHLDLGGIGKGRTADLVLAEVLAAGVGGACVNLGGDVAVGGVGPDDGGWLLAVDDPFRPGTDLAWVVLVTGAVVTSSAVRRQWHGAAGDAHHLIDPSTGRPGAAGLAAVTVVAGEAAWAEILAKAAFLAGPVDGARLVTDNGGEALLVTLAGEVLRTPGFAHFERELPS